MQHPLTLSSTAADRPSLIGRRIFAGCMSLGASGVLGLAAYLTPSATGIGTHEQLRLPSCAWVTVADLPCPTCGMTTAFAHAADGNLLASLHTQPLGCLLAIATAMALLLGIYVAVSGSPILTVLARRAGARAGWVIAAMVVVAWGYKIASHRGWI